MNDLTRRDVLRAGTLGAASLAVPSLFALQGAKPPLRLGIQSYSLRGFDRDGALDRTKQLGLKLWEAYPAHIPQTQDPKAIDEIRAALAARGIKLVAWGVQGFSGDEAACKATFDFALSLGIEVLSADPTPEAMPILSQLCKDTGIKIAIHNHGPGARYDKVASVIKALDGTHENVGACIDTGHALRSHEDPVAWAKALRGRVHNTHLKDVKDATRFTVLGQGDLRLKPFLDELRAQDYKGPLDLEYEENPADPMADLRACVAAVRNAGF